MTDPSEIVKIDEQRPLLVSVPSSAVPGMTPRKDPIPYTKSGKAVSHG